jgi:hypothetical protein
MDRTTNNASINAKRPILTAVLGLTLLSQVLPAAAYETYGKWSYSGTYCHLTESHAPDGAKVDDGTTPSVEFQRLQGLSIPPTMWQHDLSKPYWQHEYRIAMQKWAPFANLNFRLVEDSGTNSGGSGGGQLRSFGMDRADSYLAYAYYPGGSIGGDNFCNTRYTWNAGPGTGSSGFRLAYVYIHEVGHNLGIKHSTDTNAAMYAYYQGFDDPQTDDINAIRYLYGGPRQDDNYDKLARNDTALTPTSLTSTSQQLNADLTSYSDVDCYQITVPGDATSMTVTAEVSTVSMLAPTLHVVDSANNDILASIEKRYGEDAIAANLPVTPGHTYTISVLGTSRNSSVKDERIFAIGSYILKVLFGGTGGGTTGGTTDGSTSGTTSGSTDGSTSGTTGGTTDGSTGGTTGETTGGSTGGTGKGGKGGTGGGKGGGPKK